MTKIDAKRVLREIRILRCMKHENILELLNVLFDDSNLQQIYFQTKFLSRNDFGDIYLVTNYMEIDLHKIIHSKQALTDDHRQYIIYQLLRGLKYLHSANIIHRDLKPGNILATENCDIRMCDFGLSRNIEDKNEDQLTEYVVTRYYRSPEIMLSAHEYSKPVDIWAVGCTFVELITGLILFQGNNYIKLIKIIFEKLGKPTEEDLGFITNENAKKYIKSLPDIPKVILTAYLINKRKRFRLLLNMKTRKLQIQSKGCLKLIPLSGLQLMRLYGIHIYCEEDMLTFQGELDFQFEKLKQLNIFYFVFSNKKLTLDELRKEILQEINIFKELNEEPLLDIPKTIQEAKSNKIRRRSLKFEKQAF